MKIQKAFLCVTDQEYLYRMQLFIFDDYESLSHRAADEIISLVKHKPDAVLCLAAGNTPVLTYKYLVQKARDENIDFSNCTFIGLDEWVGIPPDNEGSCAWFLRKNIFNNLNFLPSRIHLFDALAAHLQRECTAMDRVIVDSGGIDLMVVGIGMNGHIGFNEPDTSFDLYSHISQLDATTRLVGQKYFKEQTSLGLGLTLGLKHLLESKKVVLLANGRSKADIIQKALLGEISPAVPASIIRRHTESIIMIDKEVASHLKQKDN